MFFAESIARIPNQLWMWHGQPQPRCLFKQTLYATASYNWHFWCLCAFGWWGESCQNASVEREIKLSLFVKLSFFFPLSSSDKSSQFYSLLLPNRLMISPFYIGVRMQRDRTHLFALWVLFWQSIFKAFPFASVFYRGIRLTLFYGKEIAWHTSVLRSLHSDIKIPGRIFFPISFLLNFIKLPQ